MATRALPRPDRADVGRDRGNATLAGESGRRRRLSLALIATLLTTGSALGFVTLWMSAGERRPVLAVGRDVPAGRIIEEADLTVVRVATDPGLEAVGASALDEVVGQPAASDLLAGTLLVPDAVGEGERFEAGMSVIAVPVPTSELPAPDLAPGDRVLLYDAPPDGAADLIGSGTVYDVQLDQVGSTVRVSVTIEERLVPDVAAAVRSDRAYVALASGPA